MPTLAADPDVKSGSPLQVMRLAGGKIDFDFIF
jgi:hypothetical protein